MAVIQKIRSKAGLLIGALGIALLAFILGDFFNSGTTFFNKAMDNAFEVDGDVVSTGDYQNRVTEWEEFEKMNNNLSNLDANASMQIREMVYQQIVKEKMLDNQAEKLGLIVTNKELSDIVYGTDILPMLYRMRIHLFSNQQTGQFDKAALIQFLEYINKDPQTFASDDERMYQTRQKQVWTFIENRIRYQRLEEKYAALVASSVLVNDVEIKANFEGSKSASDIAYVVNKYTNLSDSSVSVSDDEIKKLYDKRKNNFKLDTKLAKISYFVKDIVPSEEDYSLVSAEMQKAHTEMQSSESAQQVVNHYSESPYVDAFVSVSSLEGKMKEFVETSSIGQIYGPAREGEGFLMFKLLDKIVAPDSVELQMIALPQSLDLKASEKIVDSLYATIKGGKSFDEVANELMPGSNGGRIGKVTESQLVDVGINKQCFAAAPGEVLKLTVQGHPQLFKIVSKSSPVSKVKLAVVSMSVLVSDKTQTAVDHELSQFITENGNNTNFNKAAKEKGYAIMADAMISPVDFNLGGESDTRQVIRWAFNEEIGTVKKFDLKNKRIVAIVSKHIEDPYMDLADVKDGIKMELIQEKKAEKMISEMKAKNLTTLDAYAQAYATKVDSAKFVTFETNNIAGPGFEPILNVYSVAGQPHKISEPLKGNLGVYVATIYNRFDNPIENNPQRARQTLRQASYGQFASQSIYALREKMQVKDNRIKFW